jgi:hypothetical protein
MFAAIAMKVLAHSRGTGKWSFAVFLEAFDCV